MGTQVKQVYRLKHGEEINRRHKRNTTACRVNRHVIQWFLTRDNFAPAPTFGDIYRHFLL